MRCIMLLAQKRNQSILKILSHKNMLRESYTLQNSCCQIDYPVAVLVDTETSISAPNSHVTPDFHLHILQSWISSYDEMGVPIGVFLQQKELISNNLITAINRYVRFPTVGYTHISLIQSLGHFYASFHMLLADLKFVIQRLACYGLLWSSDVVLWYVGI